jgi:DNA-binding CsgD family transcriptional regulator
MLTSTTQEKIVSDIQVASCEVETLGDFGSQVLPLLERLVDTSASLLYRCNEQRAALPLAGSLAESAQEYYERYYFQDPAQAELRSRNVSVLRPFDLRSWRAYLKSSVYLEFQRPRGVHDFLHLRISKDRHEEPGMVGMLLARSPRQANFKPREEKLLRRLLPLFGAVARRSERLEEIRRVQSCVKAILQRDSRAEIALKLSGSFLWASPQAEALLGLARGGKKAVPDALALAARRLATLLRKGGGNSFPATEVLIPRPDAAPLRVDLRLTQTDAGHFILAELEPPGLSPRFEEVAARFELTAAEKGILGLVALGLSDREIGHRLFISRPTVRSHLGRILDKMGVHSRVQAALMAHGFKPEIDSSED